MAGSVTLMALSSLTFGFLTSFLRLFSMSAFLSVRNKLGLGSHQRGFQGVCKESSKGLHIKSNKTVFKWSSIIGI